MKLKKTAYTDFCSLHFFLFFCKIDDAGCIVLQTAVSASECGRCSEWERLSRAFPASWKWPHHNRGCGRGVMRFCSYCHANEADACASFDSLTRTEERRRWFVTEEHFSEIKKENALIARLILLLFSQRLAFICKVVTKLRRKVYCFLKKYYEACNKWKVLHFWCLLNYTGGL